MPTGGVDITKENLKSWFDAGATCVGIGSKLISKDILHSKDYNKLQQNVAEVCATIKAIR
jgi:2-dehydro-3-deoxyphosphogluconate aldolase/(4S)-4-hydroxy-2-oxoglutarate aldolase